MTVKDILIGKYGERGVNETPNAYIKRCVKELETNIGFNNAHKKINNEFKKSHKGKEYTDLCVYITGNEREYAKALSSI